MTVLFEASIWYSGFILVLHLQLKSPYADKNWKVPYNYNPSDGIVLKPNHSASPTQCCAPLTPAQGHQTTVFKHSRCLVCSPERFCVTGSEAQSWEETTWASVSVYHRCSQPTADFWQGWTSREHCSVSWKVSTRSTRLSPAFLPKMGMMVISLPFC